MVNYSCFERLAMNGDSEQSETVRLYFSKLREFLTENQHIFYQSLTNYADLEKYRGKETIYFFVCDERYPDIIKYGRTKDIVNRLRVYNVGRIREVELTRRVAYQATQSPTGIITHFMGCQIFINNKEFEIG